MRDWAGAVRDILHHENCKTVTLHGMSDRSLAKALLPIKAAQDGSQSDLVVSIDAPGLVDSLGEIHALAKSRAFVVQTKCADVRAARAEIEKRFRVIDWLPHPNGFATCLQPLNEIGELKGKAALGDEHRLAHTKANIKRISKRLEPAEAHDRLAVLVCYGPSLKKTWGQIPKDADICSVSGSHDFLLERGLVPKFHIESDPRAHKAKHIAKANPSTHYLLASMVHSDVLDKVEGHDVTLWHAHEGKWSEAIWELEPDAYMVTGGGSAGHRAIGVLYGLGYRKFQIHGMDFSFESGEQHAGSHAGKKQHVIRVTCGGFEFETSGALVMYARQFFDQLVTMPDAQIDLCGWGLLQAMAREQAAKAA